MSDIQELRPKTKIKRSEWSDDYKRIDEAADKVFCHFKGSIPNVRVLCFFDDVDREEFKKKFGQDNKGFMCKLRQPESEPLPDFPDYLLKEVLILGPKRTPAIDYLIYLHGTTCLNDFDLTMTLAHELQHVIQSHNTPKLFALNEIATRVGAKRTELGWCDIPIEFEARLRAKRTVEVIFGTEAVSLHIDSRIQASTDDDQRDWECIKEIDTAAPFDLRMATATFFEVYKLPCRAEFDELQIAKDPDFVDLNFDSLVKELGIVI